MAASKEDIVRQINEAFMQNNMEGFLDHCSEDVKWTMAGEKTTVGKEQIREWMKDMKDCEPPEFGVDRMISNEDSVVCFGDMKMKGENGEEPYTYCDIYQFDGDKVIDLRSFVVKDKTGDKELSAAS